jgi:hypothetical protein
MQLLLREQSAGFGAHVLTQALDADTRVEPKQVLKRVQVCCQRALASTRLQGLHSLQHRPA